MMRLAILARAGDVDHGIAGLRACAFWNAPCRRSAAKCTGPPRQIVLTFTEGVEPLFSTIELRGAGGSVVPTGKPQSAPGNNRQLAVDLPALAGR